MAATYRDRGWLTSSLLAGLAFAAILILVSAIDSGAGHGPVGGGWNHDAMHLLHGNVGVVLLCTYLLIVFNLLEAQYARAYAALSRLQSPMAEPAPDPRSPHQTQRGALVAGALVGLLPHASWLIRPPGTGLAYGFHVVGTVLIYALAMRLIVFGFVGTLRFNRMVAGDLDYDVLDPLPLEPVTDWSLGLTASCSGGITIGLLLDLVIFAGNPTLMMVLTYGLLSCVAAGLFFINTWSAHRMMLAAKKRELGEVRRQLRVTYDDVANRARAGQAIEPGSPASFLGNLLDLERRLVAAPNWPYTSDTLRRLGAAVFLPLGLFVAQQLIGRSLR